LTAVPRSPAVLRAITGADIKPSRPAPTSAVKVWFSFIFVFTSRVDCEIPALRTACDSRTRERQLVRAAA